MDFVHLIYFSGSSRFWSNLVNAGLDINLLSYRLKPMSMFFGFDDLLVSLTLMKKIKPEPNYANVQYLIFWSDMYSLK